MDMMRLNKKKTIRGEFPVNLTIKIVSFISVFLIVACSKSDDAYELFLERLNEDLKYQLYEKPSTNLISEGVIGEKFEICLRDGKRIFNVGGNSDDKRKFLWFENNYGLELVESKGMVHRVYVIKKDAYVTKLISKPISIKCKLSDLTGSLPTQ